VSSGLSSGYNPGWAYFVIVSRYFKTVSRSYAAVLLAASVVGE
jgi:hypothetical protein